MFIPAFVISIFLYSFIDVYWMNRHVQIFWQKINGKIILNINWKEKKEFTYLRIGVQNKNEISYLTPNKKLICNYHNTEGDFFVIIQGRLDVFRKIVYLPTKPEQTAIDLMKINSCEYQDSYFQIRPYKEGDNLNRIDPIQTIKRNQVYIRENISDIIRKPKVQKLISNISIAIKSNLYIKKRENIKKGVIYEWSLIIIGLLAMQLEWGNYMFSIIAIISIGYIYLANHIYKLRRVRLKKMNYWMTGLFLLFIAESIITADLIEAGIHFLLLVSIMKHRFVRERRDGFTFIFLILFIFVAISFFALKIWFIFLFIIFLLNSIGIFSTYSSGEKKDEYTSSFGREKTRTSFILMNIQILIITFLLFFILPHGSKFKTNSNIVEAPIQKETGFSENVSLDNVRGIKQNFSKYFLVEDVSSDEINKYKNLYWRGMRFNRFQDLHWIGQKIESDFDSMYYTPNTKTENWEIKIFPTNTKTVFLPKTPLKLLNQDFLQMGNDPSIINFKDNIQQTTNIKMVFLINANGEITDFNTPSRFSYQAIIDTNTNKLFEPFFESIPAYIIKDPNKIMKYIQSEAGFTYSLDKPAKNMYSFLYGKKQGHGEYVATGLASTLNHFNYKVSFVNGFHGGDYNELSKTWIVRGEHAHSWVEIMDNSGLWHVLDATPSVGTGNTFWFSDIAIINSTIKYYDLVEFMWYRHIVQFDIKNQQKLWHKIFNIAPHIFFLLWLLSIMVIMNKLYQKKYLPYIKLSNKQKFLAWLSKKNKCESFVLSKLEKEFPALTKQTRDVIYGETSCLSTKELKKVWYKTIKKKGKL